LELSFSDTIVGISVATCEKMLKREEEEERKERIKIGSRDR
jgi:hypothetical protein